MGPVFALEGVDRVVGRGNEPGIPNTRTGELTTQTCRHGPLQNFNDPSECRMGMKNCKKVHLEKKFLKLAG